MLKTIILLSALLVSVAAYAQSPQAQISLDYYIQSLQQTDLMAAQLMLERDTLKHQVEMLTRQLKVLTDKKEEPKK